MTSTNDNKFDKEKHDDYLMCPRTSCKVKNAPPESDEFEPKCWRCGEDLGYRPVEVGDIVEVEVFDIHQSGSGLGRTEEGFIVMLDDVFPEKKIKAEITNVRETTADADLVEVISEELEDEEEEEEDDGSPRRRDNYWGEE